MSFFVKICGLTRADAVAAAVQGGADAIGFVFAPSPRAVTPARAAELVAGLPASVEVIAVCRHPSQALVDEIVTVLKPHRLQTDEADFASLRLPPEVSPLPVLRSGAAPPARLPARFLYEGEHSGSGTVADWAAAAGLARAGGLVLAGGLRAANVADAIAAVRPAGVDVSSGVESAPGIKDPELIRQFIALARASARTLSGDPS